MPSTDMSNLAVFSSKTLLSFNCESSQRPYIRKVKIESMQDSNAVFFEFDCVDEFSNNMPTVHGASFYAILGTVELLFYVLMLMSLLNCCFHSNHHVQSDEDRNNHILEINHNNRDNNRSSENFVDFVNKNYNKQDLSCFLFRE